jgi:hypothetical protein
VLVATLTQEADHVHTIDSSTSSFKRKKLPTVDEENSLEIAPPVSPELVGPVFEANLG